MSESKSEVEKYTFTVDIESPESLKIVRGILETIDESNDSVISTCVEIEADKPFESHGFTSNHVTAIQDDELNKELSNTLNIQSSDSARFRIYSVLVHEDTPITVEVISDKLENTEWDMHEDKIYQTIRRSINENNIIKRENEDLISYELTEESKEQIQNIEKQVQDDDDWKTYIEIQPEKYDFECEICGERFQTGGGLGSHKYFKHNEESEEDEKESESEKESEEDDEEISINSGTNRFYSASVLYNSAKPVVPRDIESRLEGTEWEVSRSSISATLGKLYSGGLVTRSKRRGEHGQPYEYVLTDDGEEKIEEAIESAKEIGAKTFEDVVAGK